MALVNEPLGNQAAGRTWLGSARAAAPGRQEEPKGPTGLQSAPCRQGQAGCVGRQAHILYPRVRLASAHGVWGGVSSAEAVWCLSRMLRDRREVPPQRVGQVVWSIPQMASRGQKRAGRPCCEGARWVPSPQPQFPHLQMGVVCRVMSGVEAHRKRPLNLRVDLGVAASGSS